MFTLNDIPMFIINFFLILPLVTLVHETGHVLVARLFGGKIRYCIGTGKLLFHVGPLEVRRMYFMEGWCQYEKLSYNKTWAHVSIYLAGSIFNLAIILMLNVLITQDVLPVDLFFYQYSYFSVYFIFFSLFPYRNGDGKPSDGMAIYDVIRYGKAEDPID
ncbi:site-2 protease family protein [Halobacillus sp. HZG1]|uniref:site-2 protease family protein n=1 Tax=Halobacillus sp. HZG1 TaxID=3111769 RepID=UPI002DB9D193|nr:site-2 protease family protein [Halobacillus sp. HZG1]MEC3882260.1 site-2 protease family protein [Halobacillus sp. HZG1]